MRRFSKLDFRGVIFWYMYHFGVKINIILFNRLIRLICIIKGVNIGNKVTFNGMPIIRRHPNSTINLGNNCRYNSAKKSVIVGRGQPCSFVTLTENAEITFGNNSGATGVKMAARKKILIGDNVLIGGNSMIIDNDFHDSDATKRLNRNNDLQGTPVIIEDNVFIGFNSLILKGVTIGENSVIGANSVVFNSIPKNSLAIGNPCKVIMRRNWG